MVWADILVTADDLGGAKKALEDFKMERFGDNSEAPVRRSRGKGLSLGRRSPTGKAQNSGTFPWIDLQSRTDILL